MKTLSLLACICALISCFSFCEGHRRHPGMHHRGHHYHGPPFHHRPQNYFPPGYPRYPPHFGSGMGVIIMPKFPFPHKCPQKNNTVVNNNTQETATEAPPAKATTLGVNPPPTEGQNENKVTEGPTVTPKETRAVPTTVSPTSSPPESTPDTDSTSSPAPPTQGSTSAPKQDKASQILSDLNKLWQHIMGVLKEQ